MRTPKLFLVPLALIISLSVEAQSIDPASEWRVDFSQFEPDYYFNSYYRDFIDGVSIIDSVEYYNVYYSGYTTLNDGPPYYFNHVLHGYLREENNKWYTYIIPANQDALLFDFNLQVNDTVYSAFTWTDNGEPVIVTAVDSVFVDGEYRKRMHLNFEEGSGAGYIIEGIGATTGLFENMWFFEWYSDLVCYAKEGVPVWGASGEECDLTVNITENQPGFSSFSIYPNPCRDYFVLSCPTGLNHVSFTLVDVLGSVIFKDNIKNPSVRRIKVNDYHSGIYFAIFENKGQRHTAKLIIE